MNINNKYEKATLGGGCFWCVEAIFEKLDGVVDVYPGYSGGHVKNPSYKEVCTGSTGHAEVVQITFDPLVISYKELLEVFFQTHNPTTPDKQGNDVGTQYRSVVFYHNDDQKQIASEVLKQVNETGLWENPVVTEIMAFKEFYRAEDYHNDYFRKNPNQAYCRYVIAPKVEKFQKVYFKKLKSGQ